jgi:hypothetical protein
MLLSFSHRRREGRKKSRSSLIRRKIDYNSLATMAAARNNATRSGELRASKSSRRHERAALWTARIGELEMACGGPRGGAALERLGAAHSGKLGWCFGRRVVASVGWRGATCSGELEASGSPRWHEQVARSGKLEAVRRDTIGSAGWHDAQAVLQARHNGKRGAARVARAAARGGAALCKCTPLSEIATVQEGMQLMFISCAVEFISSDCISMLDSA